MGWSIGYDYNHQRDIGYGVPAHCDHPGCNAKIDRGVAYTCGGVRAEGRGCGLHFCDSHLAGPDNLCERCREGQSPFDPKPDHPDWVQWKLTDHSWQQWRDENPEEVERMRGAG